MDKTKEVEAIKNTINNLQNQADIETNKYIRERYREWIEFHSKRLQELSKQP